MKKILISVAVFAASFTALAQVGIGTTTPQGALDVVSANSGLIVPRVANTGAVTSPVDGMIVYDLGSVCLKVFVGGVWSDCFGQNTAAVIVANIVAASSDPAAGGTPSIADLNNAGLTNVTGDQTVYEEAIANASPVPTTLADLQAVIDAANNPSNTTIVEVTGPNNLVWMDRNLGASQAATSSTDAATYGSLYQWGRATDGHEQRASSVTNTQADAPEHDLFISATSDWRVNPEDNLWQGVNGVNNPCPAGYKLPTDAEFSALGFTNSTTAYGSTLKLSLAGYRNSNNGDFVNVDSNGVYWSSTINGGASNYYYINGSSTSVNSINRAYGFSVRCRKD